MKLRCTPTGWHPVPAPRHRPRLSALAGAIALIAVIGIGALVMVPVAWECVGLELAQGVRR